MVGIGFSFMTSPSIISWLYLYGHFMQSLPSENVSSGSQQVRDSSKLEVSSSIYPVELASLQVRGGFRVCSNTMPFFLQSLFNRDWKEVNPVIQKLIPVLNQNLPQSPAGLFCLQLVTQRALGLAEIDYFSLVLHYLRE